MHLSPKHSFIRLREYEKYLAIYKLNHAPGSPKVQLQDIHQPHETGYQIADNMQP